MTNHIDGHTSPTEADVLAFVQHHAERLGCNLSARAGSPGTDNQPDWFYYDWTGRGSGFVRALAEVELALASNSEENRLRAELAKLDEQAGKVRARLEGLK